MTKDFRITNSPIHTSHYEMHNTKDVETKTLDSSKSFVNPTEPEIKPKPDPETSL